MIYNLENQPYSNRHGIYAGNAGDKDGILFKDEPWIVKYPKTTKSMSGDNLPSYTSSPLSEYLGSHIYGALGFDVHETILGKRNGKIVVACRDFCRDNERLAEIRGIKNAANRELSKLVDKDLPTSATGDLVNLDEIRLHLRLNPILKDVDGVNERFWDMVVIDIFIDNNDRNNGNWGIVVGGKNPRLAPVYDNGNAFFTKTTDAQLATLLRSPDFSVRATGSRTAYLHNDHQLSAKKMLAQDIPELKASIIRNVPLIQRKMADIDKLIAEIPEAYENQIVFSPIRKEVYSRALHERLDKLLVPAYEKAKSLNVVRCNGVEMALSDKEITAKALEGQTITSSHYKADNNTPSKEMTHFAEFSP